MTQGTDFYQEGLYVNLCPTIW